jgi:hypothetical protein
MDKKEIKIYLAHYKTTRFFERQVNLIRKFIQYNRDTATLQIYGFVDSPTDTESNTMREKWIELDVIPIDLPRNRSSCGGTSYSMAFNFIYNNYIQHNTYISIFLENDMFPIDYIDIDSYCKDYKMCGEIRFDGSKLPDRMIMFYLGLQIFNHTRMTDKDLYSGMNGPVKALSGNIHNIDCGGESYYWLNHNENYKYIRHIPTIGSVENYDPFISSGCDVHNITSDIEHLPEILREGYNPLFRVVNYDNKFLHLELMSMSAYTSFKEIKNRWFNEYHSSYCVKFSV